MANLLVRNLDEEIVMALKAHAGAQGISVEAAHRRILEHALRHPRPRSLVQVLAEMPDAGRDEDFARSLNDGRSTDVSD